MAARRARGPGIHRLRRHRPPERRPLTSANVGIAVIIVNYRTRELTRAAVASVLSEAGVREVVIVDNGSGDGSEEFLRAAFDDRRVRIVRSAENRGFGRGVNLGVANVTSLLLLILNSDATLSEGSLGPLIETLISDDKIGAVAPAVYGADGDTPQWGAFGALPSHRQIMLGRWPAGDRTDPQWVSGVAILLRRADFVTLGGFDEDFTMYFEDIDLCRRLRLAGKVVRRVPAASVVHSVGGSWTSNAEQRRRFQQSKLIYLRKIGASWLELSMVRLFGAVRVIAKRHG